jgi:hypothetical protein
MPIKIDIFDDINYFELVIKLKWEQIHDTRRTWND